MSHRRSFAIGAAAIAALATWGEGGTLAATRVFAGESCEKAAQTVLDKGDKLENQCNFLLVFNDKEVAKIVGKDETRERLIQLFHQRVALSDETIAQQQAAIDSHKHIEAIENKSHDELLNKFNALDAAATQAVANTRSALALVRRVRIASYVSSGVLGGGAGAVLGTRIGDGAAPPIVGGIAGVVVGLGLDYLVLHIVGMQ